MKLWEPSEEAIESAQLTQFARYAVRRFRLELDSYPEFYRWSVEQPEQFWDAVWEWCGVKASRKGTTVLADGGRMPGAHWFPEARLNFAENLLKRGDRGDALVFWDETGFRRRVSYAELCSEVSRAAQALAALGLRPGDRAAAFIPNMPETAMLALAAISQGIVWSSCAPDLGADGALERFGQIEPKVLFCADGYLHDGVRHDSLEQVRAIAAQLPSVRKIVVAPNLDSRPDVSDIPKAVVLEEWLKHYAPGDIACVQMPFEHPLYILFTSDAAGGPRCVVHGAGGALLAGLKTHKLQFDVRPGDRFFCHTACDRVTWNLLLAGLAAEASVMLYDGSPFARNARILFDYCDAERFTHFGTSAEFIDSISKLGLKPRATHDLAGVRMIISTGSPPAPESYDYVYRDVKRDVCLSPVSGGADIMAAFADANPILPVYRGELQCRSLGLAVEVYDETGRAVVGKQGETVCAKPFPSMPLGFWNDRAGERYHAAYFAKYPNVWCHGERSELTRRGTMIVHGHSDAAPGPSWRVEAG